MSAWIRIICHLSGGGLVLTLADPPQGGLEYLLIFGIIAGSAYLDRWLLQPNPAKLKGHNILSMQSFQQSRTRRGQSGGNLRERKNFEPVFSSGRYGEIDELLGLLRSEGLSPMMLSKSRANGEAETVYQVHLPAHELGKARPILKFFQIKARKNPS